MGEMGWVGMDGWVGGAVAVPKENHIECWCGEGLRSGGMHMDGCACKEMHTQTRPCGISAVSLKQCRANSELSRSPDAIYGGGCVCHTWCLGALTYCTTSHGPAARGAQTLRAGPLRGWYILLEWCGCGSGGWGGVGWGVGEGNQMMGKRRLVDSPPLFATKEVPLGSQLW